MTNLLLIRHADTEWTKAVLLGRLPGKYLSAAGRQQATDLRPCLTDGVYRVFTSPRERAIETAELVFGQAHTPVEQLAEFDELDYGDWSGRSFLALEEMEEWKAFNRSRATSRAPGGESLMDVEKRVVSGVMRLVRDFPRRTVAVVTHGDVIRTALTYFAGSPLQCFDRFRVDTASVTEVECFSEHSFRIARINVTKQSGW